MVPCQKDAGLPCCGKDKRRHTSGPHLEEAGNLAAFYSKGRTAPKVEIDYLQKKNVKKPAGAKPGFVVYYTNYSLMASPDIAGIQQLS